MKLTVPTWLISFESILKMYMAAKFGGHRSYRNANINSYFNFYMDTLEKAEASASIGHIVRFSKSGIKIYISKVYI